MSAPSTRREPNRWAVLAVLSIAQLMVVLDATIVTIAIPSAQNALHFSTESRQWIITAYALAFGSLLLLGGSGITSGARGQSGASTKAALAVARACGLAGAPEGKGSNQQCPTKEGEPSVDHHDPNHRHPGPDCDLPRAASRLRQSQ